MAARWVPATYINKRYTGPRRSVTEPTTVRVLQKAHWVDPLTGKWVTKPPTPKPVVRTAPAPVVRAAPKPVVRTKPKPKPKPKKKTTTTSNVYSQPPAPPDDTGGDYQGLDASAIEQNARAYAASVMAAKAAAIQRAEAAAMAAAQRDAATYQALGSAQMGMISQIPANIQAIRNTAGQAMSQFGNQIAGGNAQQLQAEQAAAASFGASQGAPTGTPAPPTGDGSAPAPADGTAAPTAGEGTAPVATGPGVPAGDTSGDTSGATAGLNAQAAMAASAQMGGVLPARNQAEIGAASAIAAEGMPAVVARATQDQVAMRMAQAATEDADYRQQLIDLAAEQGGVYSEALSQAWDIEGKKYDLWSAEQKRKQDLKQYNDSLQQWREEMDLKKQAELAAEVQAGIKTRAQALKDWRNYKLAQGRLKVSQGNLAVTQGKAGKPNAALSKTYGYIVDSDGNPILDANGNRQPVAKTPKAKPKKTGLRPGGGRGIDAANTMAQNFRGTVSKTLKVTKAQAGKGKFKNYAEGDTYEQPQNPKVSYNKALKQIVARLVGANFPRDQAIAIAQQALNTYYGPRFRYK